ncbi:tRNA dihydrouridine synthase [Aureliella helgolandensis]|uniref:tRNA dihydrouridine synthase n=1 Tax=Aureliella helgolandensis TaxID=2527968 RepID=UPI001E527F0B|nr:tRNA-dihydrouridine synthase family protein [Aureliella helgolandensis]
MATPGPAAFLKPLRIGNLDIGFPVVQAALSGYSDWPMRMLAREHGASYSLCEVMLDQFLITYKGRDKNKHFLHNSPEEQPVAGQLMGSEPEQFALGARRLVEAGFAVIDINFGCPVKKVLGRCRGGYHLSQPDVALEIVRQTRDIVPPEIPVTVKMRRGIDDTQESRDHFYTIFEGAFKAGVVAATVHGRTVVQRYNGPSRWEFLAELKQAYPQHVILGSGDLFTAEDCLRMMAETGVDGVTVARGAIGNPWIFEQALALSRGLPLPPPPTVLQQRVVLERHWALAEQIYGPERTGQPLRKFGIKYSASHPRAQEVRTAFTRIRTHRDWQAALDTWYSEDAPGVYPSAKAHRVQGSGGDSCG